ncbi:CATRA conflict system CASPASE/TPR repeat-associated protein [Streptomyces sp. NPDC014734]|uniref:CATRA conflict system CASPASE/TPR repeat-associated protein n=1 Tax=Streptomyces sp. NPDC014734 TaxID=3364886 RepID=UPI0036F8A1F6
MPGNRFEGRALIVHTFVPPVAAVRDADGGGDRPPSRLWARLGDRLGMTDPVPGFGPVELPAPAAPTASGGGVGYALLASRQCSGPSPAQAFAYRVGDAIGVTAVLFPGPGVSWRDLRRRWDAAAPLSELPGSSIAYVHRVLDNGRTPPGAGRLDRLLTSVPAVGVPVSPEGSWRRSPDGYLVRFAHAAGPGTVRSAVVVGPASREAEFDAWLWHIGPTGAVAPFLRGLEGAARLRHHASVHRAHRPALHELCARLSAASERLAGLCGDVLATGSGPDELITADASIAALYVGDQGLNQSLRDLRDMRQSTRITLESLADLLPPAAGAGTGPDQDLGRSLLALLDDDIAHTESVKREADEISRTTESIVRQRLALLQQRTTVVQGAVLGSLLTALAAVQTLSYKLPLPGSLHAPLITWLSVLALLLPVQSMRWRRADGRARRPSRFDRLSVLCLGAATGWLGASVFSVVALHVPARPAVSAGCAVVCALVSALADRRWVARAV